METTIEKTHLPIIANERGYYPIRVFYYVVDPEGYWARGESVDECTANISKMKGKKLRTYSIWVYAVTNPDIELSEAVKELRVANGTASIKTANAQYISRIDID